MARLANKLTARQVNTFGAGWHGDGEGLYLKVTPTGGRSWVFRYKDRNKVSNVGLGPVNAMTLAQAREAARVAREYVGAGRDPRTERDRAAVADQDTRFEAVALAYIDEFVEGHRKNAKHRQQWKNTLKSYAYPIIGKMEVRAVTPDDIQRLLRPIWTTKNETAMRLRGRMETILNWARSKGWRSGDNPASKEAMQHLLPSISRTARIVNHPAMPYVDVPGFMTELAKVEGLSARALELTILTAVRTSETLGATWDEINLSDALWTIPGERMKAGRDHLVPLPAQAIKILKVVQPFSRDGFVFPGRKAGATLSNMAMILVMRRMELGQFVPHGFRSSFRDWIADETEIANEVAEACLAHAERDKTERAYRRGKMLDRRRAAMTMWADFCVPPTDAA